MCFIRFVYGLYGRSFFTQCTAIFEGVRVFIGFWAVFDNTQIIYRLTILLHLLSLIVRASFYYLDLFLLKANSTCI